MPFSRNLNKYPADYLILPTLPRAALPLTHHFASPRAARSERMRLYGFGEALRAANHPLVSAFDALIIRVEGATLIIDARDDDQHNAFIRTLQQAEHLATAGDSPPPTTPPAIESAVERFLRDDVDAAQAEDSDK